MRIRSLSDVLCTAIAWFPFLAVAMFCIWVLMVGAVHLESVSYGSEHFISNQGSVDPYRNAAESDNVGTGSFG